MAPFKEKSDTELPKEYQELKAREKKANFEELQADVEKLRCRNAYVGSRQYGGEEERCDDKDRER